MDCSRRGLSVSHHLPKFAKVHVHFISLAIQLSDPLMPSSPSALNLSHHQGLFQWVSHLHQMTEILEFQLQHQSFQWVFRIDFPYDWLVWSSLLSKGLSGVFFSAIVWKNPFFSTPPSLPSNSHNRTWPLGSRSLDCTDLVGRVISLLFNRDSTGFLPRSKHLISRLQSPSAVILEPKKKKSASTSTFPPSICHEVMGLDAMILVLFLFFNT